MTDPTPPRSEVGDLPRPIVKKMRWPFPLIWIVPLLAAALVGYYAWRHFRDQGPEIVIAFSDGGGLRTSQSRVTHRGVPIGKITDIELSPDQKQVLVHVRLDHASASIARAGTLFWIVRPEISGLNVSGLGTVVSGPYIETIPGAGDPATDFTGLERAPVASGDGLIVVLHAPQLQHLSEEAPVTYRGVQVGQIQASQLHDDATTVDIFLRIWPRYKNLVHTDSQFWSVSGLDVKGGIFTGIQAKVGSLGALVTGGVAFATPEDGKGAPAETGAEFTLNDESKKEWLKWTPKVPILPDGPARDTQAKELRDQVRAVSGGMQSK